MRQSEELKQEICEVEADIFDKDNSIVKLEKLNKILEKEIQERKIEVLKLRKKK